MKLVGWFH